MNFTIQKTKDTEYRVQRGEINYKIEIISGKKIRLYKNNSSNYTQYPDIRDVCDLIYREEMTLLSKNIQTQVFDSFFIQLPDLFDFF